MTTDQSVPDDPPPGGFERRAYDPNHVKPRRISFSFPADVPRYYMDGWPARTHLMNSFHLFVPAFERMMVRVLHEHIIPRLQDPHLIEQARGFMLQEGSHSRAHDTYLQSLRALGYDIDGFIKLTEWILGKRLESTLGPKIALSITAGFEHYTDVFVLLMLRGGDFPKGCDPRMWELFAWHAAEEVEHNGIAYELLRAIDDRYSVRMVGNVLGLGILLGLVVAGMGLLLHQDGKLLARETARETAEIFFTKYRLLPNIVHLFKHYAERDYHPTAIDYGPLAAAVLDPPPRAA